MTTECTVVIAPADLMGALAERLRATSGELVTCPDSDIARAIETVVERKPTRVALERLFAATSRGAALLTRLKADPALVDIEIRIVSHDSDYSRVSRSSTDWRRARVDDSRRAAAAGAARPGGHAARATGDDGRGRRRPGGWRAVAADRPVAVRRAGALAHRAQAQSARADFDGGRTADAARAGAGRLGEVRAAEGQPDAALSGRSRVLGRGRRRGRRNTSPATSVPASSRPGRPATGFRLAELQWTQ